ncbi:MAG: MiaB/RimO family radical SAM methylthiotransferase, partial [Chloroflexota bacterium]
MRYHITTLGCAKNTVDSEMMGELLAQAGHRAVENPRRADVVVVNTCGFIAAARDESYAALRALARSKGRRQWLVAVGCLAQRYGDEIKRHVPQVDAILGTRDWPQIAAVVEQLQRGGPTALAPTDGAGLIATVRRRAALGATAYLQIADGCDAACAFCAIPLIKGRQRSKPPEDVLREARELVAQDVREIILIAQDTTAYGRDLAGRGRLSDLLRALAPLVPATSWLRLLYAYPQHVSPALIETMASLPQMCHYLDLPLQHGHPEVLKRMARPHDVDVIYGLVEDLRRAMP